MTLKKHENGFYYAHLTGGETVNLRTKNRAEAAKLATEARLAEIEFAKKANLLTAEAISKLSSGGRMKCAQAIDEWKAWATAVGRSPNTIYQTETYLKLFLSEAGLEKKTVASVTEKHADTFVNSPGEIGASTRSYRLSALQTFFTFATARGYTSTNPAALVQVKMHLLSHKQKEKRQVLPFTKEEMTKLKTLEDPFWKVAVLLGYEAGLRIGDVAKLEWESFKEKDTVTVWTDKHDRRVSVPISHELYETVMALPKEDDQFVFPKEARESSEAKTRSKHSVYFGRILTKHGIEGKGFHSLRHTFATRLKKLGNNVDEIRDKLGHRNSSTTNIYIHD